MRNNILFLILIFAVILNCNLALAGDEADPNKAQLNEARKLVEQKFYAQALERYSRIVTWLRNDPELLIEWARVYTYADKHAEAIKLFEEIRASYPNKAGVFLRELADQYKWNGQLKESIVIYLEAIKNNPEDLMSRAGLAQAFSWNNQKPEAIKEYDAILNLNPDYLEALNGKAEVLSWMDKLKEASGLYKEALDKDPENLTAQNGRARILVWQGYYLKGIEEYEKILQTHPKNIDALEGLAFALHWQGSDGQAIEKLNALFSIDPGRKEARKLFEEIKNSQQPFIAQLDQFFKDNNPQTIITNGLRSGLHLDYATSIDAIYAHQILRKKNAANSVVAANRAGIGLDRRLNKYLEFNSFLYETDFSKTGFDPFTTNTWLTYRPDDFFRFDLAYDRETFDDNDALAHKITVNSGSLSVDLRPDRFWFFNLRYKRGYYSDDNRQDSVFAKAEYRIFRKPFTKLYYNYYYSDMGEPDLSHGYFNPRSINSHVLCLYSGINLNDKLFLETQVSGGYELQRVQDTVDPKSNHPVYFIGSALNYRLSSNWLLSLRGEFFNARPDRHSSNGYIRKSAFLSLTYNFGANPPKLREATSPSRATSH